MPAVEILVRTELHVELQEPIHSNVPVYQTILDNFVRSTLSQVGESASMNGNREIALMSL